jgi:hypothetical protein
VYLGACTCKQQKETLGNQEELVGLFWEDALRVRDICELKLCADEALWDEALLQHGV